MRRILAIALVFFAAPFAYAEEPEDKPHDEDTVVPAVTEKSAPNDTELRLTPVVIEERAEAEAAAVQEMPRRGSFWWLVGVIVVAGIILAVVL